MAGASYDLRGRLLSFYVVPPQLESPKAAPQPVPGAGARSADEPDWAPLSSAEARLDPGALRSAWSRSGRRPFYVDARFAWEGRWPARPELALRIEAASYRGRPVWFEHQEPLDAAGARAGVSADGRPAPDAGALHPAAGGSHRHRRRPRLPQHLARARRPARRLPPGLHARERWRRPRWALRAHHVADPAGGVRVLRAGRGAGACWWRRSLWLFYLALEPYVRRLRPWTLVSWTRLLNGGIARRRRRPRRPRSAWPSAPARCSRASRRALIVWSARPRARSGTGVARRPAVDAGAAEPGRGPARELRRSLGLGLLLLFLILRPRHPPGLDRRGARGGADRRRATSRRATEQSCGCCCRSPSSRGARSSVLLLRFGRARRDHRASSPPTCSSLPPLIYAPGSWTGSATPVVVPLTHRDGRARLPGRRRRAARGCGAISRATPTPRRPA